MTVTKPGRATRKASPVEVTETVWPRHADAALLSRLARGAASPPSRPPLAVEAPFTGQIIGTVPAATPDDVVAAITAARVAQPRWAATPPSQRAAVLLRFHDLLIANAAEVLDLVQLELGKSRKHAFDEVMDTAVTARYYAHAGPGILRQRLRQGALPLLTVTREHHRPKGIVGLICPWNFPLILSITDALAALMAGNAVVIKPDAQTPFTALWAVSLLREAGLPAALVQVVTGRGAELGPALIDGVDYLMFTGSSATGRLLAERCGARLMDCSMELGGKNAAIVLDDAPDGLTLGPLSLGIDSASGLAFGITTGAGQVCISTERLFVQDGIYDRFVPRLAVALGRLRLGAGFDWARDVGTLSSAEQLDKVRRHVDDAVAKGARVLAGGHARPDLGPYFFEPTLLEGVTPEMELYGAETFGPVCAVYRFSDPDDAVARANDTEYGLSASIWTRDGRAAQRIAAGLQAGTITVNDAYQAAWASASPMGGFRQSGVGRRHGRQGLLKFTEAQTVATQHLTPIERLPGLGNERYAQVYRLALRALKYLPGID